VKNFFLSICYDTPEFYSVGKTMRMSVQIGGFRRKIQMASTYGMYATDPWL